ncbi:GRAM domain-containing protein [Brevibacterium sp. 91QC2O2]|uniref:GRAM domain-containing protein n=1 Tax=Brevibacterium sp. 91QC2O2 TaxID=2968458 RepID=UPI00211CC418|nr:GRAM domain-containing protein [Brevibacterium sp. 91QC2O2]MCQ9369053.1 GRAM domain-containing protein [Brevibacterium sp. 91QC2O2]
MDKEAFTLRPGETILHSGRANVQRGIDHSAGDLVLTNQRLHFTPHVYKAKSNPVVEIPLQRITAVEHATTKAFGFIPLVANALLIHQDAGGTDGASGSGGTKGSGGADRPYRILLDKRKVWEDLIEKARAAL